jgi:hypothetical protein
MPLTWHVAFHTATMAAHGTASGPVAGRSTRAHLALQQAVEAAQLRDGRLLLQLDPAQVQRGAGGQAQALPQLVRLVPRVLQRRQRLVELRHQVPDVQLLCLGGGAPLLDLHHRLQAGRREEGAVSRQAAGWHAEARLCNTLLGARDEKRSGAGRRVGASTTHPPPPAPPKPSRAPATHLGQPVHARLVGGAAALRLAQLLLQLGALLLQRRHLLPLPLQLLLQEGRPSS